MNTLYFYPAILTLHLAGLTLMAGTTLIEFVGYRTYWKLSENDKDQASGVLQLLSKLARPIGIGAALLILTGICMMALTHGVFGEQTWFRVKFGLVIILIANSLFFGRRQGNALIKTTQVTEPGTAIKIMSIKRNLKIFHVLQLLIFFTIVLFSVFKFN
ncbi:Predicted membrane protein [Chitinophaga costaii]|uniref:Predicted membrane protein n=1 Tax=Chitinophaga costaii TaxID=1335309 RepID=A0A1C4BCB4_9BACT|nr:DUF2214 family protein [Chitinophaga costaii]PUZ27666.1 DUF2214 domain-containing protein [Chitinophaga costaii]SCC04497.1 Predicted membrane protein [Chitinophaga costaii]